MDQASNQAQQQEIQRLLQKNAAPQLAVSVEPIKPIPAPWSWRCFFGLHHWLKWSEPGEGVFLSPLTGRETTAVIQVTHCANCNKHIIRKVYS